MSRHLTCENIAKTTIFQPFLHRKDNRRNRIEEICSMIEGGMAHSDDTCFRSSNEDDSALSAGNSSNMTSPISTSAHSSSVSSVDEGVGVRVKGTCKRKLFASELARPLPGVQDEPIDLSMKKKKYEVTTTTPCKISERDIATHNPSRPRSNEVVVDEPKSPTLTLKKSCACDGLSNSTGNSTTHSPSVAEITSSLTPTYLPWSYRPRPGGLSFPTSTMHSLWHPALLMTQAARHLNPSISSLTPYSIAPIGGSCSSIAAPTNGLQQIYGQNVLEEFSRMCTRAKRLYEGQILPDAFASRSGKKESTDQANTSFERQETLHEKFARENGVRIKQESSASPESVINLKRRRDNTPPESSFQCLPDEYSNIHFGKRIREGIISVNAEDSPPTMIPNMYSEQQQTTVNQQDVNRVIPKPVDFKPCRFPCNDCGRTYATVGGLLKHSKSHHDPENNSNFKCKTCDKEYNSLGALKMHIRTHTLPCKCHICGKAFSRTWLLQGHIRTHTGEKPYQCTVCTRAFADRSNLRAHMQTHESVKRYACTSCDKTFSRISLLNRHRISGCVASSVQQPHSSLQAVSN